MFRLILLLAAFFSITLPAQELTPRYRVLVFTKTTGYRHADAIEAGNAAISSLGKKHNFAVENSEDASLFNNQNLKHFQVVVFLNTTGNVLSEKQQKAFEQFIGKGGGYVGIHSAADTEYDWPWYGSLVGAYFAGHPQIQNATINVTDRTFPATTSLPVRWTRTDEWYNFRANPRQHVRVLMILDEHSYEGGSMGSDHPIAWAHEFGGGRAFYTGLGHTRETYSEPLFLQHLLGALNWAASSRKW